MALQPHAKSNVDCRQNRRRGAQVRLNLLICSAAEAGTEELLQLVHANQTKMNLVNLSTALHRLARLENGGSDAVNNGEANGPGRLVMARDARLGALLHSVKLAISSDTEHKARCLSTVAWATARLWAREPDMMQSIGDLALAQLGEFKPFELVILLWSFVKLHLPHLQLFRMASEYILAHLDDYTPSCLATAVWSFATAACHPCSNFCRKAADAFAQRLDRDTVNGAALENMMWGLATMQVHPKPKTLNALAEATLRILQQFKVHEFTITLWAFARLGSCHEQLFNAGAALILKSAVLRRSLHPQGVANLMWAFAKYSEKGSTLAFQKVATVLLPACQKLLLEFKPQELGCVLCSLSKLGKIWGEDPTIDHIFVSAAYGLSEGSHFFTDLSLQSIVNMLSAYGRLMAGQQGQVALVRNLVVRLLCMCPRFAAELDGPTSLTILESAPVLQYCLPELEQALAVVATVASNHIEEYSPSSLARLAAAVCNFHGAVRSPLSCLVARRLLSLGLGIFSRDELAQISALCCDAEAPCADLESLQTCLQYLAFTPVDVRKKLPVQTCLAEMSASEDQAGYQDDIDVASLAARIAGAVLETEQEKDDHSEDDIPAFPPGLEDAHSQEDDSGIAALPPGLEAPAYLSLPYCWDQFKLANMDPEYTPGLNSLPQSAPCATLSPASNSFFVASSDCSLLQQPLSVDLPAAWGSTPAASALDQEPLSVNLPGSPPLSATAAAWYPPVPEDLSNPTQGFAATLSLHQSSLHALKATDVMMPGTQQHRTYNQQGLFSPTVSPFPAWSDGSDSAGMAALVASFAANNAFKAGGDINAENEQMSGAGWWPGYADSVC